MINDNIKTQTHGSWALAFDLVVVLALFGLGSCVLCSKKKEKHSVLYRMGGVMGSTIGAHVQKHWVLKNN